MDVENEQDWLQPKETEQLFVPDDCEQSDNSAADSGAEADEDDRPLSTLKKDQDMEFMQVFREICKERIMSIERNSLKEWNSATEHEKIVEEPGRRTITRKKHSMSGKEQSSERLISSGGSHPSDFTIQCMQPNFSSAAKLREIPSNEIGEDGTAHGINTLAIGEPYIQQAMQAYEGDKPRRMMTITKTITTIQEVTTTHMVVDGQVVDDLAYETPTKVAKQTPSKVKAIDRPKPAAVENAPPTIITRNVDIRTPSKYVRPGRMRIPSTVIEKALEDERYVPTSLIHDLTLNGCDETISVRLDEAPVTPYKAVGGAAGDPMMMARKSAQTPRLVRTSLVRTPHRLKHPSD